MPRDETEGGRIPSADSILNDARSRGEDAGESAASNVFDWGRMRGGRAAEIEFASKLLRWREDGDPRLDEYVDEPDWLSGEWAGESIKELIGDLIDEAESYGYDIEEEIMNAYEEGAHSGFWSAIDAELDDRAEDDDDLDDDDDDDDDGTIDGFMEMDLDDDDDL